MTSYLILVPAADIFRGVPGQQAGTTVSTGDHVTITASDPWDCTAAYEVVAGIPDGAVVVHVEVECDAVT